jgi:CRP-like cAMP-binding protein
MNLVTSEWSADARRRLSPYLTPVQWPPGHLLCEVGARVHDLYFIEHGAVSLIASTETGLMGEVALVSDEGIVGFPGVFSVTSAPYAARVVVPTRALRVRADIVTIELGRDASVQKAMLAYAHQLMQQMTDAAMCYRAHTARQRLCRWLLTVTESVGQEVIPLTQDVVGDVIGAGRQRVSIVATQLQDHGLIRQRRGSIRVIRRSGLEQWSCACFQLARARRRARTPGRQT